MAGSRTLQWGKGRRPKASSDIGTPYKSEGSNGDIQIRNTNLGAKIFGKVGGRWLSTNLSTQDEVRLGINERKQLFINSDGFRFGADSATETALRIGNDGAISIGTSGAETLSIDSSGNITTKGVIKVSTAASGGDLGFLLENDGTGYNQLVIKGANPEIWMGWSGSGTSMSGDSVGDDGDINGSSKLYLNRGEDALLSTIVFTTAGTANYSLGGTEGEFRIVTGADIRTDATRALYIGSSKEFYAPDVYTSTAGAANVSVANGGRLTRITSSKRYKDNINYDGVSANVLYSMKPCSYIEKVTGTEFIGFVAEDVHEIEPRLIEYRDISEKNEEDDDAIVQPELVPDAIKYDHISAILVKAVQELSAKIDTMQTEINNLK